ncbi:hypothetical protein LINPERHAP1_LOCUS30921, partial [Linum perenne]
REKNEQFGFRQRELERLSILQSGFHIGEERVMESSEEEDDFPSIETITPHSKIDSLYQSHTKKGIRKLCCELLDLKDALE